MSVSNNIKKNIVTNAINDFFKEANMTCKKINTHEIKKITLFIKLLNDKILDKTILLYDINSKNKGKIINITIDGVNNIKYKYEKGYKDYSISIPIFIYNIYICDNKIFLLPPNFKYNKDQTINFNSINITNTNINDLISLYKTSSAAISAASSAARVAATSSTARVAAIVENAINNFFTKDITSCYIIKNDGQLVDYNINLITTLNAKIITNNITLTDINYNTNGKITNISIIYKNDFSKYKKFANFKSSNDYELGIKYDKTEDYYPVPINSFISNIYINQNNIFFLIPGFRFNKTNTPYFNSLEKIPINIDEIIKVFNPSNRSYIIPKYSPYKTAISGRPLMTLDPKKRYNSLKQSEHTFNYRMIKKEIIDEINKIDDINEKNRKLDNMITLYKTNKSYKINYDNLKNEIKDYITMPPPPSKKRKLGGNNKRLRRKIYINNDGKLFIKLNKNIIIDLYN
jgi:hypothetical protein